MRFDELQAEYPILPAVGQILEQVKDVSGKEVRFRARPDLHVTASTKIARERMPYHLILFKSNQADLLNHLIAHECGHILRTMRAAPAERVVPASTPETTQVATKALERELAALPIPPAVRSRMLEVWIPGLITQLTNLPVDVYIEQWIYAEFPNLREEQARFLARDAAQNLQALSKEVERVTPRTLFRASNAMNYAYMQEIGQILGNNYRRQYRLYRDIFNTGRELHRMLSKEDHGYATDIRHINSWAKHLGIDRWFIWQDFEDVPEAYFLEWMV